MSHCFRYVRRSLFLYWLFMGVLSASGADFLKIDGMGFAYRVPPEYREDSQIMVLFGGRNWDGEKTLKAYGFDKLADKHRLFLLSPSFVNREYWEPGKWSGATLKKAMAKLEQRYKLKPQKCYFYGYSAGGQCAALFYGWMPERVAAWGVHACGVYPEQVKSASAPALISCGTEDAERFQISRQFAYRYREAGGALLWKIYAGGHELNPEALELARVWFDAIISGETAKEYGEDDTGQIKRGIDDEFRNPLYNEKIRELWLK